MQYSGGTDGAAFSITTNLPDRLAGKVHIDDTAVGGARVDAEFDLPLTITFKTARRAQVRPLRLATYFTCRAVVQTDIRPLLVQGHTFGP